MSWEVKTGSFATGYQYRDPLELTPAPFVVPLNPGPLYDHSGVYLYRILPLPITLQLTFKATGLSYVEVLDADNQRFLLGEKVPINSNTAFSVDWDGDGVFEPRVWKGSQVTGISLSYQLPKDQIVADIRAGFNAAPYILGGGLTLGFISALVGLSRRRRK